MSEDWLDELGREMRRQAARTPGPEPREVLDWLGARVGAQAALVAPDGGVEACTAGFPAELIGELRPLLTRIAGGRMASAATESTAGGTRLRVRCEALGPRAPRPVLVVAGPGQPTTPVRRLVAHAASLMTVLYRVREAERASGAYDHKAAQLRLAVLTVLLAGDLTLARRLTTGAVPPLLEADRLRVLLLHCAPGDRDRLASAHQDPSGYHGRGLMVSCPVYDTHLVCVAAADGDDRDPGAGLGALLHRLVGENPGYALGISAPHPLTGTARAYEEARHALAMARGIPARVARFRGQAPLERLLPRAEALAWARGLLRPLRSAPRLTTEVTRLALAFPRTGVARLLGISRNTVAAHLRRAEDRLGLGLDDIRSRADLALALELAQPAALLAAEPGPEGPAAGLPELLRTPAAAAWAASLLDPLRVPGHRKSYTTLLTWIDSNADAQRAARRLGISRNTVAAHLRIAEQALGRDLLNTGAGIHDLVHALRITGEPARDAAPAG